MYYLPKFSFGVRQELEPLPHDETFWVEILRHVIRHLCHSEAVDVSRWRLLLCQIHYQLVDHAGLVGEDNLRPSVLGDRVGPSQCFESGPVVRPEFRCWIELIKLGVQYSRFALLDYG